MPKGLGYIAKKRPTSKKGSAKRNPRPSKLPPVVGIPTKPKPGTPPRGKKR